MRMVMVMAVAAAASAACGSQAVQTMPPRHLSATEHDSEAQRHERAASEQDRAARARARGEAARGGGGDYGCYDQEIPDPELGGERVAVLRPCWTSDIKPTSDSERAAALHRRQAIRHRDMAASLRRAERDACAGLGAAEIGQSPFFHREDIAGVEPVRDHGRIAGAVVLFRQVRGLDVDWMRKSIACHQARAAALGYPPRVTSYSPLMVAPARAQVDLRGHQIAVTITARRDEDAAAILGRARALVSPSRPTGP
ncbi:MAG TPA: hypothetical protein VKB80_14095 [Kofleriaceae bacterium]|nr:hypothetical protein [Kofleriaceae bacterium]